MLQLAYPVAGTARDGGNAGFTPQLFPNFAGEESDCVNSERLTRSGMERRL